MKYAILPCNGLDKSAGPVAREAALWLAVARRRRVGLSRAAEQFAGSLRASARRTAAVGHRRLRDPVRHEAGQSLGAEDRTEAPGGGRGQTDGRDPLANRSRWARTN